MLMARRFYGRSILNKSKTAFEFSRNKLRASILTLALVLAATIPHAIRCQADETAKHNVLRKVAQEWMQVGREQYDRSLFEAAGQSFRRAALYRKYLTTAEQKKLGRLSEKAGNATPANEPTLTSVQTTDRPVRPAPQTKVKSLYDRSPPTAAPVKAKRPADSVKDGKLLTEKELEFIAERPVTADNPLREHRAIQIKPARSLATGKPAEAVSPSRVVFQSGDVISHRVFVRGQVSKPGVVQMPGEMTALEAIMEVGGFDLRAAERKNVIVIRYADGRRYAYKLDLRRVIAGCETEPFYLQPKDIVYVPRTGIAELNQWIDQHINQIIPDTGFFLGKTGGDTTVGAGSHH